MLSKNQIKEIQSLQIKKFRDARQLFIAEGIKTVSEIMEHRPELIGEIFAVHDFILNHQQQLSHLGVSYTGISDTELEKISLQQSPNQVLAVCRYLPQSEPAFDFETNFSLYLDEVRDPGNFGTIIRLADWFGISTVFCSQGSCDLYNPKVIQSTMGAFLRVRVVYAELEQLLATQRVPTVYGALLKGHNLYQETLRQGLIVIGNEANGIREQNMQHITRPITIPAHRSSGSESLNAAVATSILVSEFFRQLRV